MPPHICEVNNSGRLLAAVNTTCPAGSTEFRGAGINLFDLFWCGSTGMGVSAACTFNESASMLASYKGPNFTGPLLADQAWPRAVLDAQVRSATAPGRGAWALSTLWAWECYTHRADMVCLWPNSTRPRENASDAMIEYVQRADARMRA